MPPGFGYGPQQQIPQSMAHALAMVINNLAAQKQQGRQQEQSLMKEGYIPREFAETGADGVTSDIRQREGYVAPPPPQQSPMDRLTSMFRVNRPDIANFAKGPGHADQVALRGDLRDHQQAKDLLTHQTDEGTRGAKDRLGAQLDYNKQLYKHNALIDQNGKTKLAKLNDELATGRLILQETLTRDRQELTNLSKTEQAKIKAQADLQIAQLEQQHDIVMAQLNSSLNVQEKLAYGPSDIRDLEALALSYEDQIDELDGWFDTEPWLASNKAKIKEARQKHAQLKAAINKAVTLQSTGAPEQDTGETAEGTEAAAVADALADEVLNASRTGGTARAGRGAL